MAVRGDAKLPTVRAARPEISASGRPEGARESPPWGPGLLIPMAIHALAVMVRIRATT
jgi:hypothetical protein